MNPFRYIYICHKANQDMRHLLNEDMLAALKCSDAIATTTITWGHKKVGVLAKESHLIRKTIAQYRKDLKEAYLHQWRTNKTLPKVTIDRLRDVFDFELKNTIANQSTDGTNLSLFQTYGEGEDKIISEPRSLINCFKIHRH